MEKQVVKQTQILKIAVLLSILISIPRNLHIYNMVSEGKLDFSGVELADLIFRLVFLFLFSYSILQLNANLGYTKFNRHPNLRLIVLIVVNIIILFGGLEIWKFLHSQLFSTTLGREDMGFLFFRYSILLLVLFFIARILRLQTDQQQSILENERLKQENLRTELAALKNQIDPHFLFNSLNTLTSLVRENEKATQFVSKLSFIYRYILQSSDTDLVTLKDELKFLQSYTYLIQTRYRDRFELHIQIDEELMDEKIPPMALQILVENAVKHNEISETHPLKVEILSEGHTLYVKNRIKERSSLTETSGYGLHNLKKRFLILKKIPISINKDNGIFEVKLPLK